MTNFSFLSSVRFWAIVGIGIVGALKASEVLSEELSNALITILMGYTVIRTVDRFGDKIGK